MRNIYAILVLCVYTIQISICTTDLEWAEWKMKHSKDYITADEESNRRNIWTENYKLIQKHNMENHSYTLELNHLADITNEEFQKTYLSQPLDMNEWKISRNASIHVPTFKDLPSSINWGDNGYVTKVKNQGSCGSCWAFSATGALEGQYYKSQNSLKSLSEQELVDCSWRYGNAGCNGGLMDNAFMYVRDYGICSGNSYSYVGYTWRCKSSYCTKVMSCKGYKDISSGSEYNLAQATAEIGPISVAIDASQYSFQFYSSGVYYDSSCSSSKLNHGVLVTGYGTSNNGKDYWIVKNSWGTSWGKSGYILMSKNRSNNCGIATAASYPVV